MGSPGVELERLLAAVKPYQPYQRGKSKVGATNGNSGLRKAASSTKKPSAEG